MVVRFFVLETLIDASKEVGPAEVDTKFCRQVAVAQSV
jgi:hypothetical protein